VAITNLAYTTSDNSMGGAVLTFAFLIILFAIVATVLYIVLFSRPHPRVPARRLSYATAGAGAPADPGAARAAATAAGMPTASGGGSAESATEPAGAGRDITPGAAGDATDGPGKVTGGSGNGTTDHGTEGGE
jgi:hypothetical protein